MTGKWLVNLHVTQTTSLMALQAVSFLFCFLHLQQQFHFNSKKFSCIPPYKCHRCSKGCHHLVIICAPVSRCVCRQKSVVCMQSMASCICCQGHDLAHARMCHLYGSHMPDYCSEDNRWDVQTDAGKEKA